MVDYVASSEAEMLNEQAYDASNKKMVNDARKKEARLRREELDFIRTIMSNKEGRRWILGLLNTCKTFSSPIVSGDPHFTYHNIGEQNIGKKILQDINDACPEFYTEMMKEARGRK